MLKAWFYTSDVENEVVHIIAKGVDELTMYVRVRITDAVPHDDVQDYSSSHEIGQTCVK